MTMFLNISWNIWADLTKRWRKRHGSVWPPPVMPFTLVLPHFHRDGSPPIRTSTPLQCTLPQPCMKYDTADCNNTIHRAFNYGTAITKVLLLEPGASIYTSLPLAVPPGLSYCPHPVHWSTDESYTHILKSRQNVCAKAQHTDSNHLTFN